MFIASSRPKGVAANSELHRWALERFNVGDLDGFLEYAAPDVRLVARFSRLAPWRVNGHAAARHWHRGLTSAYSHVNWEIDRIDEVAPERTVMVGSFTAVDGRSGERVSELLVQQAQWRTRHFALLQTDSLDEVRRQVIGR
jgi:hypothetical protein